jgi:hypothetical protein
MVGQTSSRDAHSLQTLSLAKIDSNNSFIPIAVGPNGEFGSLFPRFLHGSNPLPLPTFRNDRPNASRAAELAISNKTPFDILGKADKN